MASVLESQSKLLPSYVAFTSFKNFVRALKESVMPSRIDKSVMPGLSGGTQSHLLASMKYLELIDEDGTPTARLERLVESYGTDEWQSSLGEVVRDAYEGVLQGLDIQTATPKLLEERFKAKDGGNVDGTTATKSIRFYLAAIKDAGIKHSSHLTDRKPQRKRTKTTPIPDTATVNTADTQKPPVNPPPATSQKLDQGGTSLEYPVYFHRNRKAVITVPVDLTDGECKMIELALPLIRAYADQMNTGK